MKKILRLKNCTAETRRRGVGTELSEYSGGHQNPSRAIFSSQRLSVSAVRMNFSQFLACGIVALLIVLAGVDARAQDGAIEVTKPGDFIGLTPPTPIAVTGFSGTVAKV